MTNLIDITDWSDSELDAVLELAAKGHKPRRKPTRAMRREWDEFERRMAAQGEALSRYGRGSYER